MKKIILIHVLAAFAVLPATLSSRESVGQTTFTIKIENFTYNPNPVAVPAGTRVIWINRDVVPHDVISDDQSFKSKLLEKDEQFTHVFSKPGTYHYKCSLHARMSANVIVQ
jgi:plastocyanin